MKCTLIVGSLALLSLAGGGYAWSQMRARGYS
jgi:hypothetical protein